MDLEAKRKEQKEFEMNQNILISKYLENKRKNFEYADVSLNLLEKKNEEDLIVIGEKINQWYAKAKDENKNQFLEILMCLFRVQSYFVSIQTICKSSVSEFVEESKRVSKLESEIRSLKIEILNSKSKYEQEIESLKKELEFVTTNK